jgi:receptor expression-enhancing protein 1/2/3/4
MYFLMLSLLHLVENTFDFILSWVPFWSWMRFAIHIYLILPGSGGATLLYQEYLEPFLYHHEREIDDFITESHDRAKSAGLELLQQGIEWVKVNVMGFAPREKQAPPIQGQSYAQNFMSRLNMPAARGSDNLYSLVNQALSGASALYAPNQSAQASEISRSANIIPANIRNNDDRLDYVSSQRERLQTLLKAFDQEADNVRAARLSGSRYHDSGNLSRNRSEADFDRIERDEVGGQDRPPYPLTPPALGRRESSGWMPWNWQRGGVPPGAQPGAAPPAQEDPLAYGRDLVNRARSSGFDLGDH